MSNYIGTTAGGQRVATVTTTPTGPGSVTVHCYNAAGELLQTVTEPAPVVVSPDLPPDPAAPAPGDLPT